MLPLNAHRLARGASRPSGSAPATSTPAMPRQRGLAADPAGLGELARGARKGDAAGLEAAARSFEAMLVGQMLKQMRSAQLSGDGLLDSEHGKVYQDFQDQEFARTISEGPGLGIREALLRQLGGQATDRPAAREPRDLTVPERNPRLTRLHRQTATDTDEAPAAAATGAAPLHARMRDRLATAAAVTSAGTWPPATPGDFVNYLKPHADAAARELGMDGIDGSVLLAQSALETGWGKRVPRHADGRSSFNLFGIKADRAWEGARVAVGTLEYRDGTAQREQAKFRAYDDPGASFRDYVAFLRRNPRYRQALASDSNQAFVRGLQQAGYATDPRYATKVLGLQARVLELAGSQVSGTRADRPDEA